MNYRTLGTFGSFPSLPDEYDKADALILPIGYEGSTCYMSGTKFGPDAIIEASHYMEFYDIELDYEPSELVSIYTLKEPEFSKNSMAQAMCEIEKYMDCHTLNRKFVVTIGGEHSITPPIVNSFKKVYSDLSVLHFDAHGDMRDTYEGTKFSHACAMRRCRESCRVVQLGIRSMCSEEAYYIKEKGLSDTIFYAKDKDLWNIDKILGLLSDNVYISFDFDYFDPSLMPAVGTPEPGGPGWYRTLEILKKCFETKNVVGCDVVEFCPMQGFKYAAFTAASLVYKMIAYKFSKMKT